MTIIKNTSTEKGREFWAHVTSVAAQNRLERKADMPALEMRPFVPCATPGCEGAWHVGHLDSKNKPVTWNCEECGLEYTISLRMLGGYDIKPTGKKKTRITVTLTSETVPPVTVTLRTWKYDLWQDETAEGFFEGQRYFYEEHTCPTNWTGEIYTMAIPGDGDPHGLFKLVSIVDGWKKDSKLIGDEDVD